LEYRDDNGKLRELRGTLAAGQESEAVTIAGGLVDIRIARDRIVFMKQDVTLRGGRRNKA
jgi:hypothetical protein